MADKIELEQTPHRVAWELATMIARAEGKLVSTTVSGDRKYWLDLYERCRKVVISGWETGDALKGS